MNPLTQRGELRFLEHSVAIRTALTAHESIPVDTTEDAERVRQVLFNIERSRQ